MPATKRAAVRRGPAEGLDPEIVPQDTGLEVWQNVTAGTVYLNRIGEYGKAITELVHGGRTFSMTPTERRLNQSSAAPGLDVFVNGTLQPKSLLDDEPDSERLRTNPNLFDEADIPGLFKIKGPAFAERLSQISNVAVINRLLEAAREPRLNATVHQYEMLRERERELESVVNRETYDRPAGSSEPRPVTPR